MADRGLGMTKNTKRKGAGTMTQTAATLIPTSGGTITSDELRTMIKSMSKMMDAIADGRITVDGQRAVDAPGVMPPTGPPSRSYARRG
jgi:hypothetical protein